MTEKELEKLYNEAYKAVYWTAMSILKNKEDADDGCGFRILDAGFDADGRIRGEAHAFGDLIRAFKADAVNVFGQHVGLLLKHGNDAVLVMRDEANTQVVSKTVSLKIDERLSRQLLFLPVMNDDVELLR